MENRDVAENISLLEEKLNDLTSRSDQLNQRINESKEEVMEHTDNCRLAYWLYLQVNGEREYLSAR